MKQPSRQLVSTGSPFEPSDQIERDLVVGFVVPRGDGPRVDGRQALQCAGLRYVVPVRKRHSLEPIRYSFVFIWMIFP
jgi:hypothetical protein